MKTFCLTVAAAAGCSLFFSYGLSADRNLLAQNTGLEQSGPYNTLLIENVTVIDGSGSPAYGPVNIFVKNNTIDRLERADPINAAQAGRAANAPPRADRVIDGKGLYVMPGIVDGHTHVSSNPTVPAEYIYKLLLGHGITTIRVFNVGNDDPKAMVAERQRIAANQIIAPRMYVYPFWRGSDPRFSTAEGARQIVDEWHGLGVDGVKIADKPGLWPDVYHAIAEETRKFGMGVAVHIAQTGVYPLNAVQVAAEGASVEHHYGYPEASYKDQAIERLPDDYNYSTEADRFLETGRSWLQADVKRLHTEVIDSLLDAMRKSGFVMEPTFSVYEANRDVARAESLPWHNDFTLPVVMKSFRPDPSHHASYFFNWTSNKEADWARAYRLWLDFVNDYKNRGGIVSVGSDSGSLFSVWGFGTIREMEMLEEAGFSPLEAMHAATENGGKLLKNPKIGVIRPGYLADLVIVSENPLANLKVLYGTGVTKVSQDGKATIEKCVKFTIRDGVVFDAQALLKDVRDMVARGKQQGTVTTSTRGDR
ncbi:MAG TPA: amidohydrolase family protein [Vicinamibacterales bacterium]|nr:amidohydrolase family protein [Vicinamibacterales bacterium]